MQGCAAFTGSRALQERAPPAAWQSRVKLCSQLQFADVGFAEVPKLRVGPFSGAAQLPAQRLPQPLLPRTVPDGARYGSVLGRTPENWCGLCDKVSRK